MSWAGVRKRLCDGNDWMVIGRAREVEEEGVEDEEEEEGEDKEEQEDEPFSLFDAELCRSHPEAAYLDKTLRRVSRLLAFLNLEIHISYFGQELPTPLTNKSNFHCLMKS